MCACVCVGVFVCAEAARCWQGSDIRPVALNSLCQLSQGNIAAPITLFVALRVAQWPLFEKKFF